MISTSLTRMKEQAAEQPAAETIFRSGRRQARVVDETSQHIPEEGKQDGR